MNTHKIKVTVNKKKSILAGYNTYGDMTLDIDLSSLTKKQRETYANLSTDSEYIDGKLFYVPYIRYSAGATDETCTVSHVPEGEDEKQKMIADLLDAYANALKKREVEVTKKKVEDKKYELRVIDEHLQKLEQNPELGSFFCWDSVKKRYYFKDVVCQFSHSNLFTNDHKKRIEKLNAQLADIAKERTRLRLAEEKKKMDAEERKNTQLDNWVLNHGTENQKKRHERGLLPAGEIIDGMRNLAYKPYSEFTRFKMLDGNSVDCDCEYEYCDIDCDIDFDSGDLETLSGSEFDFLEKIESINKDAVCQPRYHSAKRENCDNSVSVHTVLVELTVGEYSFSREFIIQ